MEQKYIQKVAGRPKQVQAGSQSITQRLAIAAVQKQLQGINLKEWLWTLGFVGGGAALRALMQPFPNVEPLTFLAILSGWMFGWKKGMVFGLSSLYLSNFVMFGGQGPWTFYQMAAFAAAGLSGALLRKRATFLETMGLCLIVAIGIQVVLNAGWALSMGFSLIPAFAASIPFAMAHIVSNTVFGAFLPAARRLCDKIGGFDEKEICEYVLSRARGSAIGRWLPKGRTGS